MTKYLKADDLYYELVVCKGRGKVSDKLSHMFWLIASNLKRKFSIVDFHDDQIQEAYCMMMESWQSVDTNKYNEFGVFAYFSERGKRSYTKIYNTYMDNNYYNGKVFKPDKVSLTNIHSL